MDAHQIIEQLSSCLGRTVRLVAGSPHDPSRHGAAGPQHVDPSAGLVPISLEGHAHYLRFDVERRPALSSHDYDVLSAAVELLRLAPGLSGEGWSGSRDAVVLRMLTGSAGERALALQRARTQRWLDPRADLTVHAILFDGSLTDLERFVFGRSLASSARSHGLFAGIREGVAYLLTPSDRPAGEVRGWIQAEAQQRSLGLVAVGSADLDHRDEDLVPAAEEARIAADIRATIGPAGGSGHSGDLGAWRLLHAVSGSRTLVASASPAADELWRASDPVQRETIEAYLDAGCRVATACKQLHIHRTTLYYRLENMPASVRDALEDGLKRSTLHLSLKLLRLRDGAATHPASVMTSSSSARDDAPTPIGVRPRAAAARGTAGRIPRSA